MKKFILPSLILILLSPAIAVSDTFYLILLRNGGRLTTPWHWVEGTKRYFYYLGGTVAIEERLVDRIEKYEIQTTYYPDTTSEDGGKKETPPSPSITEKAQGPEKSTVGFELKPALSNVPKTEKKEEAKKDPSVMLEMNNLEKKFESRKNMSTDELRELKYNLTELRNKIASSPLEPDFREEVNKIAEMRLITKDLLNEQSRGQ